MNCQRDSNQEKVPDIEQDEKYHEPKRLTVPQPVMKY